MDTLLQNFSAEWQSILILITIISAIIHVVFAGAVAKDAGKITKAGVSTQLVSPMTWAFATLVGGVMIAAVYWFIHHVNFSRHFYTQGQNKP